MPFSINYPVVLYFYDDVLMIRSFLALFVCFFVWVFGFLSVCFVGFFLYVTKLL